MQWAIDKCCPPMQAGELFSGEEQTAEASKCRLKVIGLSPWLCRPAQARRSTLAGAHAHM